MWPEPGDGLLDHLNYEAAIKGLVDAVLSEWVVEIEPLVLPNLDGVMINGDPKALVASLPPDPTGPHQGQDAWNRLADRSILAGVSALWALTHTRVAEHFGVDIDTGADPVDDFDPLAARVLKRTTGVSAGVFRRALGYVAVNVAAKAGLDTFLDTYRGRVEQVPAKLTDQLTRAADNAKAAAKDSGGGESTAAIRARMREVIAPGSDELDGIATEQGYQAAGVMNSAALSAANSVEDEELEKIWISTLDSKTRASHWASDGARVPIDGKFTVGNAELEYPGDPAGPPEEILNCRCRTGVLAKDEALPDEVDRHTERLDGRDSVVVNRDGRTQQEEIERRAAQGNTRARDNADGVGTVAAAAPAGVVSVSSEEMAVADSEQYRTFTDAVVAIIGTPTSDGRMLASDIDLSFRSFPLPLMWTKQSSQGHLEAFTIGVIESASVAGGKVLASGYLLNSGEADEAATQIEHRVTGPSVDLAATEWMLTDEAGNEISEEQWWELPMDAVVLQTITAAELIGTTLVSTPAFGDTSITLNAVRESRDVAVVASAAEEFRPRVYDHRLFEDPQLAGPTLPTMGDDGRIYGHLACFGECHRSIQAQCVMAPRSRSNYSHFHTSPAVRLDDGRRLPVGRLTVGTGHAPDNLRPGPAIDHYDNTGTCFALVRVGEDEHGIWFSGVAAPGASAEQIEMGLSAPLSGDWRDFGDGLELIAALAVNTPGFAARGRDDDQGRPIALVASLGPAPSTAREGIEQLTAAAIREAVADGIALAEQRRVEAEQQERGRADVDALLARSFEITRPPTPNEEVVALLAGRR